jgi:hypothetical protein
MLVAAIAEGEAAMTAWRIWALAGAAALASAGAALSQDHAELLPEAPAKATVVAACTACHDATEITTRRMSANRWDTIVSKMIDLGAVVGDAERPQIVAYLAQNFAPAAPPPAPGAAPAAEKAPSAPVPTP